MPATFHLVSSAFSSRRIPRETAGDYSYTIDTRAAGYLDIPNTDWRLVGITARAFTIRPAFPPPRRTHEGAHRSAGAWQTGDGEHAVSLLDDGPDLITIYLSI